MNNQHYLQPIVGRNQLANVSNIYQGNSKRILCVCSAGLLRSPSMAKYLSGLGFNTRSCGTSQEYALIPLSEALLSWAHEIHVVEEQLGHVNTALKSLNLDTKVFSYNIPDQYETYSTELMELIAEEYYSFIHKTITSKLDTNAQ